MRESQIEKALVRRVKRLGGEVRKVAWIGRRGAPDRFVMLQGPNKNVWVELKAPGEKVDDHQLREHERMRICGEIVLVIDSLEALDVWFPAPQRPTWDDYELSVRCTNLLKREYPGGVLQNIASLPNVELQKHGFRLRDIKEIREAAENNP